MDQVQKKGHREHRDDELEKNRIRQANGTLRIHTLLITSVTAALRSAGWITSSPLAKSASRSSNLVYLSGSASRRLMVNSLAGWRRIRTLGLIRHYVRTQLFENITSTNKENDRLDKGKEWVLFNVTRLTKNLGDLLFHCLGFVKQINFAVRI